MSAWTFFGEGGSRVTVAAPVWVDARSVARQILHYTDTELGCIEASWDEPTVEVKWVGSDASHSGSRHQQIRRRADKDSEWSEWECVNK